MTREMTVILRFTKWRSSVFHVAVAVLNTATKLRVYRPTKRDVEALARFMVAGVYVERSRRERNN